MEKKSLNIFAIVVDSVMDFAFLRIDEGISRFLLFIDIINLMPFQVFFILEIAGFYSFYIANADPFLIFYFDILYIF